LRLVLLSVGRERSDPARPLVADYVSRIARFLPIDDIVLRPAADDRVADRMLKEAARGELLVALDEGGKQLDSPALAALVADWMNRSYGRVTLVIGGADGLPERVRAAAGLTLGLSRMTLPHRLARLLLVEQLYRALCIVRGVPYQK
jgi:23S rRNA (pseudouridine1915-N3)-methyltransferase